MSNSYYIYRIYLENNHDVKIEKYDHRKNFLGRTYGKFCYQEKEKEIQNLKEKEIQNLLGFAINNELNAEQTSQLGGSFI